MRTLFIRFVKFFASSAALAWLAVASAANAHDLPSCPLSDGNWGDVQQDCFFDAGRDTLPDIAPRMINDKNSQVEFFASMPDEGQPPIPVWIAASESQVVNSTNPIAELDTCVNMPTAPYDGLDCAELEEFYRNGYQISLHLFADNSDAVAAKLIGQEDQTSCTYEQQQADAEIYSSDFDRLYLGANECDFSASHSSIDETPAAINGVKRVFVEDYLPLAIAKPSWREACMFNSSQEIAKFQGVEIPRLDRAASQPLPFVGEALWTLDNWICRINCELWGCPGAYDFGRNLADFSSRYANETLPNLATSLAKSFPAADAPKSEATIPLFVYYKLPSGHEIAIPARQAQQWYEIESQQIPKPRYIASYQFQLEDLKTVLQFTGSRWNATSDFVNQLIDFGSQWFAQRTANNSSSEIR